MRKVYILIAAIFMSVNVSHANVSVSPIKNLLFKLNEKLICNKESDNYVLCAVEDSESYVRFEQVSESEIEFNFVDGNFKKDNVFTSILKNRPDRMADFLNNDLHKYILKYMRKLYNTNIMESTLKYSSNQSFRYERMFVMGYEVTRASFEIFNVEYIRVSDIEFKINVKRNTVSQ